MKINLFFSPTKPTGGISTWTFNMLEYIRIHHIENVYHVDASIRFKNAKSHSKFDWLLSGVLDTVILVLRFWNAVKRYKPKCVHVTSSASLALYKDEIYLLIASFLKVNVVLHYRFGRISELAEQKNWEWKKLLSCIRRAKHVIVIDPMSYEVLCKEGFKEKVSYIPNPCSPLVEAIAKQAIQKKQQNKFIFVGHVIPTKGVYELVEAFTQLKEDVVLEIIGLCSEEVKMSLLKIASRKAGGKWLAIVGNKSRDYVLEEMKTAEALVLPSYTEGFPNVVLEAMACGCPVLATRVGAIAEMLSENLKEEACGICMTSHETADIYDVIERFLRANEIEKRDFAANGKKKVLRSYTMDRVFPQYERCWNY